MRTPPFTLKEYDPERPWIVRARDTQTVMLADEASFFAWAHEHRPAPQWSVELDPWQLVPQS